MFPGSGGCHAGRGGEKSGPGARWYPRPPVRSRRLLALFVLLCACADGGPEPIAVPFSVDELPQEHAFLDQIDRTKGHRDCFPVIRDPALVPAGEAPRMSPDEMVIGLDLGAVQVAYPINLLNFHEIVEQELEGYDLLVCW